GPVGAGRPRGGGVSAARSSGGAAGRSPTRRASLALTVGQQEVLRVDALDDAWDGSDSSRIFAVGLALGGLLGLLVGSAIGITIGQRSARALRRLLEELLRRSDRIDFE